MRTLLASDEDITEAQAYCAMANVDPRKVIKIEVDEHEGQVRFYTWEPLEEHDSWSAAVEHTCSPMLIATMTLPSKADA